MNLSNPAKALPQGVSAAAGFTRSMRRMVLGGPAIETKSKQEKAPQPSDPLVSHVVGSYMGLHWGTGWIAFLFPIMVPLIGFALSVPLQDSLSAYFFAYPNDASATECAKLNGAALGKCQFELYVAAVSAQQGSPLAWLYLTPIRMIFVGFLAAVAACLFLYKGFSKWENMLLNAAAVGALMIALFPERHDAFNMHWTSYLHFGGVAVLFLCVAAVSLFCSELTVRRLKDEGRQKYYDGLYGIFAMLMIGYLLFAVVAFLLRFHLLPYFILVLEAVGIWIFAFYWWTKSAEMEEQDFIKEFWPPPAT